MSTSTPRTTPSRRRPRAWHLVSASLAVGWLCASVPPLHAQKDDPRATMWLAAAGAHTAGAVDTPVTTVSGWSRKQALDAVAQAIRQSSDTALLIKGLALHTDAAILEHARAEGRAAGSRAGSTVLLDGEAVGSSPRSLHWEVGRLIANALATRPATTTDAGVVPDGVAPARAWYHASSALVQQWADCGTLRAHLEDGLKAFPTDATLLLYRATMHQTFADPRVQVWISDAAAEAKRIQRPRPPRRPRENEDNVAVGSDDPEPVITGPSRSEIMRVEAPYEELALAERDLRRALASEPTLIEARIRLAHVLSALGRKAEAAEQARIDDGATLPPFLAYYGAMVLGRAEADLGRHAEARRAFERAARLLPSAQSPQIALSRLAVADGHGADGVAALIATSGPAARGDAIDPWWSYFRLHAPDAKAQLGTFRERVR